jgi:hypothetical protein
MRVFDVRKSWGWFVLAGVALLGVIACVFFSPEGFNRTSQPVSGAFAHSVYIWQRDWGEHVKSAAVKASAQVAGFVVLAGEISWNGLEMKFVSVPIDHQLLTGMKKPIGLALRIGPYPSSFKPSGTTVKRITTIANELIADARENGLEISEFQLDFDSPESKLNSYRHLINGLRSEIGSVRLTMTALPSWLKHRSFARLAKATDGYVLQVHSLERPKSIDEPMELCNTKATLKWVKQAGRIGVNFQVALPTYGYLVAFNADKKFIGLLAEGQGRNWDSETMLVKVSSNPIEIAALVAMWTDERPACMKGVIWYRLPVETDELNWRWVTLSTIIAGKTPTESLRVEIDHPEDGLAEIMLVNDGQTDQRADLPINIECQQQKIFASDGLRGYNIINTTAAGLTLAHDGSKAFSTIRPGERLKTGWIRSEHEMEIKAYVAEQ